MTRLSVHRRLAAWAAAIVLLLGLAPVALAEERGLDQWLHERWQDATFADLLDAMQEDEEAAADAGRAAGLWRWRMNGLESAQYSVAEHALRRGEVQAAIALLERLAAATTSAELRDVTYYNLAEISRRRLRDTEKARGYYARVAGTLRHLARRRELGLLIEVGQLEQAAALAERRVAAAKDKGARLAVLHAVARAWARHGMDDRAQAVYKRIATEFTPKDIQEIIAAIEKEAAATVGKLMQLVDRGEDEDELWETIVEKRLSELGAEGRWDEYDAYWNAAVDTWNRLLDEEERRDRAPRRHLAPRKVDAPAPPRLSLSMTPDCGGRAWGRNRLPSASLGPSLEEKAVPPPDPLLRKDLDTGRRDPDRLAEWCPVTM